MHTRRNCANKASCTKQDNADINTCQHIHGISVPQIRAQLVDLRRLGMIGRHCRHWGAAVFLHSNQPLLLLIHPRLRRLMHTVDSTRTTAICRETVERDRKVQFEESISELNHVGLSARACADGLGRLDGTVLDRGFELGDASAQRLRVGAVALAVGFERLRP